ncbi:LacI family DNA-binding transcriptional regulator [Neisseria sp. S1]|uniref:LacI family DNA-binding transcriptional regulator n=1 Tax=Neisseria sp. S1 TaxID=3318354 RepID=UPI003A866185
MVTIYDVARLAGVSPKTVSRVLNQDAAVRDKTQASVRRAMVELGYIPSSAARTMRSKNSGLVGLITGAISRPSEEITSGGLPDMFLIQGAQKVMAAAGKILMIADTGGKSEQVEHLIRTFLQYRAEGILYVAGSHQRVDLPKISGKYPIVLLNCFDDEGTPAVIPDDRYGQYLLTRELLNQGHRRIAYLTLPPDVVATRLRVAGYGDALLEAGIGSDESLIVAGYPDAQNRSEDLQAAIERVLSLAEPPTVLCCGNDEMALRAYGILRTRGLKVPEDISITGYDDQKSITEMLFPPLTTAELPYVQMGEQAAALLLQQIQTETPGAVGSVAVRGSVVWRSSVLPNSKGGSRTVKG